MVLLFSLLLCINDAIQMHEYDDNSNSGGVKRLIVPIFIVLCQPAAKLAVQRRNKSKMIAASSMTIFTSIFPSL